MVAVAVVVLVLVVDLIVIAVGATLLLRRPTGTRTQVFGRVGVGRPLAADAASLVRLHALMRANPLRTLALIR